MADRARRAFAHEDLLAHEPPDSPVQWFVSLTPLLVDDFSLVEPRIGRLANEAHAQGSIGGVAIARLLNALLRLLQGSLIDAEADAWEAVTLIPDYSGGPLPVALAVLIEVLVERGELDMAEQLFNEPIPAPLTGTVGFFPLYVRARGLVHLARHRWKEALEQLLASGQAHLAQNVTSAAIPWRSHAALAAVALGDRDTARQVVTDELRQAEAFGTPRAIAVALRAAGLVADGTEGLALLQRAAHVIRGHGIRLEEARVLTDFGAMMRRRGAIRDAREQLSLGLDLAVRCGARPLAERQDKSSWRPARDPAGERHRRRRAYRDRTTDYPTRSRGLSNRQIAQALFITVKAVEIHLTNSYQELGIQNRTQLPAALAFER